MVVRGGAGMSGPTTPCLICHKATPLVGCWGRNAAGEIGELCKDCQPNRFVNPHYVNQAAAARREAEAHALDFERWELDLDDPCRTCGEHSDWAEGCSNGCA